MPVAVRKAQLRLAADDVPQIVLALPPAAIEALVAAAGPLELAGVVGVLAVRPRRAGPGEAQGADHGDWGHEDAHRPHEQLALEVAHDDKGGAAEDEGGAHPTRHRDQVSDLADAARRQAGEQQRDEGDAEDHGVDRGASLAGPVAVSYTHLTLPTNREV